jgi:autotransporter-associated beta strand protein
VIRRLHFPFAVATILLMGLNLGFAQVVELTENFTSSTQGTNSWTLTSGAWPAINNSDNPQPYSSTGGAWGPGGTLFTSPPGGGYFATDTTATGNIGGTVSDWLLTPVITLHNGDTIKFSTRTRSPEEGPSRMEVRLSTNGTSTNVGSSSTTFGDFTNVVGTVNPNVTANVYPTSWTTFTYTVTGLSNVFSGRVAFHSYYPNGGFGSGTNGDTVGLAQVVYTANNTSFTWSGAASGSWNNSGNWSPAGIPGSNIDNQLTFGSATTASMVNDIPSTLVLNQMTFTSVAPIYTLGGNGLNFKTNSSAALPQIVTNSSNLVTITAPLTLTNSLMISGSGNLSLNGSVTGVGTLVTNGTGTVTLVNSANNYSGGTAVNGGTVKVSTDSALGSGNVSGAAVGTLAYTGTTTATRSFSMGLGTLSIAANQTLTFNGSTISSAFLDGSGTFATIASTGATFNGITSTPSVTINLNSGADKLLNSTNGATLNIAANIPTNTPVTISGVKNEGSGSITVGQNSQLNVASFQTYGTITLNPGSFDGTSGGVTQMTNTGPTNLAFNVGSRTFISMIPQVANSNAGIDLNGKDANLVGGLIVNNGYVYDSTGGNHRVIVDTGGLAKGAGFWQPLPKTINGGTFIAGNSPGRATTGTIVLGGPADPAGGLSNYTWQINDAGPSTTYPSAPGSAGPTANAANQVSGWGLLAAIQRSSPLPATNGNFQWDATPTDQFTIHLKTLLAPNNANGNPSSAGGYEPVGDSTAGMMSDFDPAKVYTWKLFQYDGTYTGPLDPATLTASTIFDLSGFLNPIPSFNGGFSLNLDPSRKEMDLIYAFVPEPGTLSLVGLAGLAAGWRLRRTVGRVNSNRATAISALQRCQ